MTPTSVIINGLHRFDIEMTPNLHIEGEKCEGGMWLSQRVIKIDSELTGDRFERVLKHEIFHAYLGVTGLTELLPPHVEEAICIMMESCSSELYYEGFE